jgi:polygalacturonase
VRSFGAAGNGLRDDAPAINRAIVAANRAGGGTVELPPGRYLAGGSIHIRSNVALRLERGATLIGARTGYDLPERNRYAPYQDAGHGHFHDAMIWGEDVHHVAFVGSGTIDGAGNLSTDIPLPGRADKIISLARCDGLTISGITLERGGHFAILINDCRDVRSNDLTIRTAGDRDGWNIVSSQNVRISDLTDHAYDDALAFKSDWALGKTLPSGDVVVEDARLSSVCCNALMFGSETCGNFTNYRFSHIVITGAGKSGLGMVSMDGGHISDVVYSHVTMSGVAGPLMEKIGTRRRCGGRPGIGSISDIRYQDVRGTSLGTFTPTLWGAARHPITGVTFAGVHLFFEGRTELAPPSIPAENPVAYAPDSIGPRPSYGLYVHRARGVTFENGSLGLASRDSRPAAVIDEASDVTFERVVVTGNAEVVLHDVNGFRINRSRNGSGRPLHVSRR